VLARSSQIPNYPTKRLRGPPLGWSCYGDIAVHTSRCVPWRSAQQRAGLATCVGLTEEARLACACIVSNYNQGQSQRRFGQQALHRLEALQLALLATTTTTRPVSVEPSCTHCQSPSSRLQTAPAPSTDESMLEAAPKSTRPEPRERIPPLS